MNKSIELTEREREVLKTILRVDMDALGLSRKEQTQIRSIFKKLQKVDEDDA